MNEFDHGPTLDFAEHFARVFDYTPFKEDFWYDWGPIFYRGRLDGTANNKSYLSLKLKNVSLPARLQPDKF